MKLSNNGTTAIVVVAGLIYLGYLASIDFDRALLQAPIVVGAVFGLARILHQATTAADQSKENSAQLIENTAITQQTHLAVNSRMDELIARVEQQERTQAALSAALARAEGITTGRAQAADEKEIKP